MAAELGMSEREIICLQAGHSRPELAAMFGLSIARVGQIRAQAIRKMRHPWRAPLAIELGLADKIGLSAEQVKKYRNRSLKEALASYRFHKGLPERGTTDED